MSTLTLVSAVVGPAIVCGALAVPFPGAAAERVHTNSIGMAFVLVDAGSF